MYRLLTRTSTLLLLVALVASLAPAAGAAADSDAPASVVDTFGLDVAELQATSDQLAQKLGAQTWAEAHAEDGERVAGSLLVTTKGGRAQQVTAATTALAQDQGDPTGRLLRSSTSLTEDTLMVRTVEGDEAEVAARLLERGDVLAVEPNRLLHFTATPNDPAYPQQFAHELADAPAAWDVVTDASAVTVAVLDSGVVAEHPDLAGEVVEQKQVIDGEVVDGTTDNDRCQVGHGTWTSGIIGALGNNATDVAGAAWAVSILDVNVSATEQAPCEGGAVTEDATIVGIDYARAQGADVINMSLGGTSRACSTAQQTALDAARDAGIALIASSGNAGADDVATPASCNGVISVSAVGPTGETASYASTSPYVDLTAPSGDTPAGLPGVLTTSWWEAGERTPSVMELDGTSFSAPYVSGVAALMFAVDASLTPDDVEGVLEATAQDLNEEGRDQESGWGLVQSGAAVQAVAAGGPFPAPEPDPEFPIGSQAGRRPGGPVVLDRISAGTGVTEPVTQAVAVSQALFADAGSDEGPNAEFAVLARSDDFADALAGSSITFGAGPVLFTGPLGPVAPETLAELQRVLPDGGGVLILGGPAAVSAEAEQNLVDAGFLTERAAGAAREETAVAVLNQLAALYAEMGTTPPAAILASRSVWYDAITAGNLAAPFRLPVLLTSTDELHPATAAALGELAAPTLYVVGGEVRVSKLVADAAGRASQAEDTVLLKGETRDGTAVAVAGEVERLFDAEFQAPPQLGVAFNLSREDGYAHALSMAPVLATLPTLYLPVLGESGDELSDVLRGFDQGLAVDTVVAGDTDIISEEGANALAELLATPGTE